MGNAAHLASPVSPPPRTWLESYRGLSLPRPLPGTLVLPHLLKCTILVQEGEDQSPHSRDSGCVYTVPLLWRLGCRGSLVPCRPSDRGRAIGGGSQPKEQNDCVEPASVSSLMQICVTFRAWS